MSEPPFHIVLYQPEIPHNTGAIGRTCVALGAKLWLVRPLGFRLDDKYIRRAGLDYWEYLDWEVVDDWKSLLEAMGDFRPWFLTKTGTRDYTTADFRFGEALVFGSESRGLPQWLLDSDPDRCRQIPMRPAARCLNLSVSAGIVAFEVRRQLVATGSMPADLDD